MILGNSFGFESSIMDEGLQLNFEDEKTALEYSMSVVLEYCRIDL
jgi:hypothetical protein